MDERQNALPSGIAWAMPENFSISMAAGRPEPLASPSRQHDLIGEKYIGEERPHHEQAVCIVNHF